MHLFADSNNFFASLFDFNKLGFAITVKLASLLDVFTQSSGKQA
jgi:hypothetical protein